MSPMLITVVLTILAAVVVVLTRVRLAGDGGAGRLATPVAVVRTHTLSGAAALVVWTVFLATGGTAVGWFGLLLWWVTAGAGVLLLARWVPARGRHSSNPQADSWGDGPGLSVLAHVGVVVGVAVFTVFLALGQL